MYSFSVEDIEVCWWLSLAEVIGCASTERTFSRGGASPKRKSLSMIINQSLRLVVASGIDSAINVEQLVLVL